MRWTNAAPTVGAAIYLKKAVIMATLFTTEQEQKIASEYESGEGSQVLGERYGTSCDVILRIVRRMGVKVRSHAESMRRSAKLRMARNPRVKIKGETLARAVTLYQGGESLAKVTETVGGTAANLHSLLHRHGITTRSPSEAARRYTLNEGAFEEEESSEQTAYFAGLMFTDGSVSIRDRGGHTEHVLEISLQDRDREILERFRQFLGSDRPVEYRPTRKKEPQVLNGYEIVGGAQNRLTVTSRRLVESLARFGVTPRKTYTATVPDFLLNNRHFWRGCVDGDGSVMWCRNSGLQSGFQPQISLCGQLTVVQQFAAFVGRNVLEASPKAVQGSENCWHANARGRYAVRLAHVLYGNTEVAMARKAKVAHEFMQIPLLYTGGEVARRIGVSPDSFGKKVSRGSVPGKVLFEEGPRRGRIKGFQCDMIDDWIKRGAN